MSTMSKKGKQFYILSTSEWRASFPYIDDNIDLCTNLTNVKWDSIFTFNYFDDV